MDAYRQPELAPLYRADIEDEGDKVVLLDGSNQPDEISLWDARGKDIVPLDLHGDDCEADGLSVNSSSSGSSSHNNADGADEGAPPGRARGAGVGLHSSATGR